MMMSTGYLKDLPSFNKDNFQNYQASSSSFSTLKRRNSDFASHTNGNALFHCPRDRRNSEAQLIVNPAYNIVVKYLEKPIDETAAKNSNSNKQKRPINQVFINKKSPLSSETTAAAAITTTDSLSKFLKKRKHVENQSMDAMQS